VIPTWLRVLRDTHIVGAVRRDPRTRGDDLLGVDFDTVIKNVVAWGQADFDAPWSHPRAPGVVLTGADRALLYAYTNMKGHQAELIAMLSQLVGTPTDLRDRRPIIIDLGCGPGTGLLAAAHALRPEPDFTYVGLDRAASMLALGRTLADTPEAQLHLADIDGHWTHELTDVRLDEPLGWRPVIVLASFLLASETVEPERLLDEALRWIEPISRGPIVVLYTNSTTEWANRKYDRARQALADRAFSERVYEAGVVEDDGRTRKLRYALFTRGARDQLELED